MRSLIASKILTPGSFKAIQMVQRRGYSYPYDLKALVTPPRTPISSVEKVAWFGLLLASVTSVPIWVLYHLRLYRNQSYDDWIAYQNKWARN